MKVILTLVIGLILGVVLSVYFIGKIPNKVAVSEGIKNCEEAGGIYYVNYDNFWGYLPYCFEPFFKSELKNIE